MNDCCYDFLPKLRLEGDLNGMEWDSMDKYPVVRVIGKPVTPTQSRELLRLCLEYEKDADRSHRVGELNQLRVLSYGYPHPRYEAWFSPEGRVEGLCYSYKWPDFGELALPFAYLAAATDYLDLVALVECFPYTDSPSREFGFHLRGHCLRWLPIEEAQPLYDDYLARYGALPPRQECFPWTLTREDFRALSRENREENQQNLEYYPWDADTPALEAVCRQEMVDHFQPTHPRLAALLGETYGLEGLLPLVRYRFFDPGQIPAQGPDTIFLTPETD